MYFFVAVERDRRRNVLSTTSGFFFSFYHSLQMKTNTGQYKKERNRKFERLEPYFQTSATRSALKEDKKRAVASAHSRECTKELISGLPNFGEMETFVAGAEKQKVFWKRNGSRRASIVFVVGTFFCFLWAVQRRCVDEKMQTTPSWKEKHGPRSYSHPRTTSRLDPQLLR